MNRLAAARTTSSAPRAFIGRMIMTDYHLLGPLVRSFLSEEIVTDRNLTRNTQRSYADAIQLLLRFIQRHLSVEPAGLTVEQVTAAVVRSFLTHLEDERGNSTSTRNQRLKAIHALFHFIARRAPELADHIAEVHAIPPRRSASPRMTYLEQSEIDALLAVPDRTTAQGQRDYALLLFLYNTGARTSEVAELTLDALTLETPGSVRFVGRRRTLRVCPLWPHTVEVLRDLLAARLDGPSTATVFHNVRGKPITRFGIHTLVARTATKAVDAMPALRGKRVNPHTIRHTSAVHFLRAGTDIATVCARLGHVSTDTMNRYNEIDLEAAAPADACAVEQDEPAPLFCDPFDRALDRAVQMPAA
jgi:site-specific recombinase XerD